MYHFLQYENNGGGEKVKKRGKTKFCSKTMCTHSKWANEQTLKAMHAVNFYKQVYYSF